MEKHRNPDGTYDGLAVMSEISGLSKPDMLAIAEQVKANHAKLEACAWHEFDAFSDSVSLNPTPLHRMRYRCRHCGGEIDWHAHYWHEQGRRPHP